MMVVVVGGGDTCHFQNQSYRIIWPFWCMHRFDVKIKKERTKKEHGLWRKIDLGMNPESFTCLRGYL